MQPRKGYEALSSKGETPFRVAKKDDWVGVSFISGNAFLLAPLEEIEGIIPVTSLTPIPGVKTWLRGLTTYRSEVFPVTDLSGFLTQKETNITKDSRILMIHVKGEYYGILINTVLNLHRIHLAHKIEENDLKIIPEYAPFIKDSIKLSTALIPIFNFQWLVQDPRFQNILRANITEEENSNEP